MPAPPAPTMTTSYLCTCIPDALSNLSNSQCRRTVPGLLADLEGGPRDARIEGEDDQGAQDDDHGRADVQHGLEPHAGAGLLRVVVDDGAQAVGAVQHGQPQHGQVPELPERIGPLAGDEAEVDGVDAVAD